MEGLRKRIQVQLDVPRWVAYPVGSTLAFEEEYGHSLLSVFQDKDALTSASVKLVVHLLWAGLLHEQPQMSPRDAAALIEKAPGDGQFEKLLVVQAACMEAVAASLGIGDMDPKKNKGAQAMERLGQRLTGDLQSVEPTESADSNRENTTNRITSTS